MPVHRLTLPHTVLAAVPSQTGVESHPLDNVIWHALSGRQIHFSLGDDRARRYTADVAPFAAIWDFSPASFASLLPLVPRGDRVGMFTVTPVPQTEHFEILVAKTAHQMIATRVAGPMRRRGVERLDDSSVPEMPTLVGESQPGPFAARTNQLGDYVAIRVDGQLIAMTGERMNRRFHGNQRRLHSSRSSSAWLCPRSRLSGHPGGTRSRRTAVSSRVQLQSPGDCAL